MQPREIFFYNFENQLFYQNKCDWFLDKCPYLINVEKLYPGSWTYGSRCGFTTLDGGKTFFRDSSACIEIRFWPDCLPSIPDPLPICAACQYNKTFNQFCSEFKNKQK